MNEEIYQLVAGPLIGAVVTWLLLATMLGRRGLPLDKPNERSLHERPVPRIGGLATIPAIAIGWVSIAAPVPACIWAPAALLFVISLFDDIRDLPVAARLVAHVAAAAAVAGVLVLPDAGWIAALAAILVIAWMTNLYNFMDGSDGLAGGMTLFGFGAYAAAAWLAHDVPFAFVCLTVCAANGVFLKFNFHPARVFLGDAGSIPTGFLAAALGTHGWLQQLWPLWFPLLVFSPFVLDATVTLVRRALYREKIWQAHRQHYYQRLVRLGWGHRRTSLIEYATMAGCDAIALVGIHLSPHGQAMLLAACAVVYLALFALIDRAWRHHTDHN